MKFFGRFEIPPKKIKGKVALGAGLAAAFLAPEGSNKNITTENTSVPKEIKVKAPSNIEKQREEEGKKIKEKIAEATGAQEQGGMEQPEKMTEEQYYKFWENKFAGFSSEKLLQIRVKPIEDTEWIVGDFKKNGFEDEKLVLGVLSDMALKALKVKAETEPEAMTKAINDYLYSEEGKALNRAGGPFGKELKLLAKTIRIEGDVKNAEEYLQKEKIEQNKDRYEQGKKDKQARNQMTRDFLNNK